MPPVVPNEPPTDPHDAYAAIRHADYRRFASGFLISSMGLQMLSMTIGWEIKERTNDPLAVGFVGVARALPVILLALPAGHLIDRFNKRNVLVATQLAMGVVILLLAGASYLNAPLWVTYLLLALTGCARVFNGPSRATLLPLIVPRTVFGNAVTWNSSVFQFSAAVGPLVAGVLLAGTGLAWMVYALTGFGCLVFAYLAIPINPRADAHDKGPFSWSSVSAGMSHVWTEKSILAAITLDLFAVLLGGATALMPFFADDILHVGEFGLGMLRAAPFLGAFLMAIWLAHRPVFARAGRALLWSVAAFGSFTILFGLSTNFILSLACLVALGAVDNISVVIRHVLVQERTPEHLRGRVSTVNSVFIESSNELGAFESGAVAKLFGPVVSVVSGGIGTLMVVGGIALGLPQVRTLNLVPPAQPPRPVPAQPPITSGNLGAEPL